MYQMGQLGLGKVRGECEVTPQKCAVPAAREVHCGSEFTLWLGQDGVRHDDVNDGPATHAPKQDKSAFYLHPI
jgi:hypothetical protein